MTLIARLCALCAVCALMQMMLDGAPGGGALSMIGGLLMLHLVMTSGYELAQKLSSERELMRIFEILMQ